MRALVLLLGVAVAAATASVAVADEAASADLEALRAGIVGVWKHEHRQFGVEADTLKTYAADGSYSASSKIRLLGTNSEVNYEGEWEILEGPILRVTVTKTDNRLYVPMGEIYLMKDIAIADDVMTYTHDDKANREVRQEDEETEEN